MTIIITFSAPEAIQTVTAVVSAIGVAVGAMFAGLTYFKK